MAYQPENLSALSYANGFTIWHYRTSDGFGDLICPGYWVRTAARMLRVGDWIAVNLTKDEDRTVLTGNLLLVVTGNDNNEAKVSLLAGQAVA